MASSADEGQRVASTAEALAEQIGTPPTRTASHWGRRSGMGRGSSKKARELSREGSIREGLDGAANRRRVSSSRHQRRRDRKGARTFKELGTTLAVLGIGDGPLGNLRVTASPHIPVADAGPTSPASFASPRRGSALLTGAASSSQLSDASSGSKLAARQRSGLATALPRSPLEPAQPSGELLTPEQQLQTEREEWRAGLDTVLDSETDLQRLRTRADDLKVELIRIQTPPDPSWPAIEKHLDWLESSLSEMKALADPVTAHGGIGMDASTQQQHFEIIQELLPEVQGMAGICCDAVADSMRIVGQLRFSGTETKQALRAADRQLQALVRLSGWLQKLGKLAEQLGLGSTWAVEACTRLGGMADSLVQATLELTAELQAKLFAGDALSVSLGAGGAHEVSSQVRALQSLWPALGRLISGTSSAWPLLALPLCREWCKQFSVAAGLLETMHKQASHSMNVEACKLWAHDAEHTPSGPTGVWGTAQTSAKASVTDMQLESQAWLPPIMHRFLTEAQRAAQRLLDTEAAAAADALGSTSSNGVHSEHGLLEILSREVYDLSLVGMWRVHRMCKAPQGLSSWGLDLLLDQVSQALLFVRDLDSGSLGFCAEECSGHSRHVFQATFRTLSKATHCCINEVLSLRQLRKRKAAQDDGFNIPRPILLACSDSVSSYTESSISTFSRPSSPPSGRLLSSSSSRQPSRGPSISAELQAEATRAGDQRMPRHAAAERPAAGSKPDFKFPSPPSASGMPPFNLRASLGAEPPAPADDSSDDQSNSDSLAHSWVDVPEDVGGTSEHALPALQPAAELTADLPPLTPTPSPAILIPAEQQQHQQQQQAAAAPISASPSASPHPFKAALLKAIPAKTPSFKGWVARPAKQLSSSLEASPSSVTGRDASATSNGVLRSPFADTATEPHPQASQPINIPRMPPMPQPPSSSSSTHSQHTPAAMNGTPSVDTQQHAYVLPTLAFASPFEAAELQNSSLGHSSQHLTSSSSTVPSPRPAGTTSNGTAPSMPSSVSPQQAPAKQTLPHTYQKAPPKPQQQQPPPGVAAAAQHAAAAVQQSVFAHAAALEHSRKAAKHAKAKVKKLARQAKRLGQAHLEAALAQQAPPQQPQDPGHLAAMSRPMHVPSHASSDLGHADRPGRGWHRALHDRDASSSRPGAGQPASAAAPRCEAPQSSRHSASHTYRGQHSATSAAVPSHVHDSERSHGAADTSSGRTNGALTMPWEGDPFWQITWSQLQPSLIRKLGSGSFGQVYEAYFSSAPMAVKVMNLEDGITPQALQNFKQEVDLQNQLSMHPNVVRFCGACADIPPATRLTKADGPGTSVTLAIVMELCRFGNLYKIIEQARRVARLPEPIRSRKAPCTLHQRELLSSPGFKLYNEWLVRLKLAQQAAAALAFMHERNVLHRDVTSHNLLVTENWQAKVADFNLSRAIAKDSVPHSGSINSAQWAAPERLTGQAYNKSADVYSFGVVIWELVTLQVPWRKVLDRQVRTGNSSDESDDPYEGRSDPTMFQDTFFHVIREVPNGKRLPFPQQCSSDKPLEELERVMGLVQQCWKQLPVERPTMKAVCETLEFIIRDIDARVRGKTTQRTK